MPRSATRGRAYRCRLCPDYVGEKAAAFSHLIKKHPEVKPPFLCDCCGYRAVSHQVIRNHKESEQHASKSVKYEGDPIRFDSDVDLLESLELLSTEESKALWQERSTTERGHPTKRTPRKRTLSSSSSSSSSPSSSSSSSLSESERGSPCKSPRKRSRTSPKHGTPAKVGKSKLQSITSPSPKVASSKEKPVASTSQDPVKEKETPRKTSKVACDKKSLPSAPPASQEDSAKSKVACSKKSTPAASQEDSTKLKVTSARKSALSASPADSAKPKVASASDMKSALYAAQEDSAKPRGTSHKKSTPPASQEHSSKTKVASDKKSAPPTSQEEPAKEKEVRDISSNMDPKKGDRES